jgi:hypothetical protein
MHTLSFVEYLVVDNAKIQIKTTFIKKEKSNLFINKLLENNTKY